MSIVPDELTADVRADPLVVGAAAGAATGVGQECVGGQAKRALDVAGSLLLVLVMLPLMVVAAVAVLVTSPGPVLFRQERVGHGGRRFTVLKFRTMREDAEEVLLRDEALYEQYLANDHKLLLADDPRVTPVGKLLRKTSLDELPQLWNVLRGEMSLVGPRPVLDSELARYGDHVDAYLAARPGLTGAWQVAGRSAVGYGDRVALDADYVASWTLGGDLAILAKTPLAVLSCRGSH